MPSQIQSLNSSDDEDEADGAVAVEGPMPFVAGDFFTDVVAGAIKMPKIKSHFVVAIVV